MCMGLKMGAWAMETISLEVEEKLASDKEDTGANTEALPDTADSLRDSLRYRVTDRQKHKIN